MSERVIAVVQARMGSTRLPAKVLAPLMGEPMLLRMLQRLRPCTQLHRLVVATTDLAEDDPIAELVEAQPDVGLTRGSSEDVLSRYAKACREHGGDIVVRLTADCPLIDPAIVDRCVGRFLELPDAQYLSNTVQRTFPRGLDTEVFGAPLLYLADREARSQAEREHVTPFFWQNPERFRVEQLRQDQDLSHLRWTVDQPEDFELVRRIYEALWPADPHFDQGAILELLKREPALTGINQHVEQKRLIHP